MTDLPVHVAQRLDHAHNRIDGLEGRVTKLELADAVAVERDKHIQKSLFNIETNISRVVWLVLTAIVGAVLTFVIKGGLNVQ